ncbi:MAG: hypothetical protein J6J38_07870 [Lachnospiraceae bacterium]|nr:hypothetical protein [Lachnospiraceae bacterium]
MTSKDFVLETMRRSGKANAQAVQERAAEMTGTELNAEFGYIPSYYAAIAKMNMNKRKAGFVCRSPKGRIVRLIQPYDSEIYTQEPEELEAHYAFVWSKNPKHALPFVAISTSPFNKDECCIGRDGVTYASEIDTNTFDPVDNPRYWRIAKEV